MLRETFNLVGRSGDTCHSNACNAPTTSLIRVDFHNHSDLKELHARDFIEIVESNCAAKFVGTVIENWTIPNLTIAIRRPGSGES
jgi:hypothetical protein